MKNEKLLQALKYQNTDSPPVWLMRQAGRYLPSYRALRQKHSFETMSHHPDLIAEVTLLPLKVFPFDAAILFSDILLILEVFGAKVRFEEGLGPVVDFSSKNFFHYENLPQKMQFITKAIKLIKQELDIPLIGFAGAPFTVLSYLLEGKSDGRFRKTKKMLYSEETYVHSLLEKITDATIEYLKMQIIAGVDALQLFDSWAYLLPEVYYRKFSLPYQKRIVEAIRETSVPLILFGKGSSFFAPLLAALKPDGISLDATCDICQMRSIVQAPIAIQGNLDPDLLFAPLSFLEEEVKRILLGMQADPGFILNLGHGLLPDTPLDSVKKILETIKNFSFVEKLFN